LICSGKTEEGLLQWKLWDELFENLSKWIKENEKKIREETGLLPSLEGRQKRLEVFKVRLLSALFDLVVSAYAFIGSLFEVIIKNDFDIIKVVLASIVNDL